MQDFVGIFERLAKTICPVRDLSSRDSGAFSDGWRQILSDIEPWLPARRKGVRQGADTPRMAVLPLNLFSPFAFH